MNACVAGPSPGRLTRTAGRQPQSKSAAAVQAGMFLHTDDAWSLAYFDPNDLHCLERKLFVKRS